METEPIIAGNHLRLFPSGTAFTLPAAGTAGREAMPGIMVGKIANDIAGTADAVSDPAWIDPGVVDSIKVEHSTEERKIYKPAPGVKVLYDVKEIKHELGWTVSIVEGSPLMLGLLLGAGTILNKTSTAYKLLEGKTVKAWCHFEQYDDENTLFNTVNTFCKLTVKNVDFADDLVKYDLVATTLYSSKAGGTLANVDGEVFTFDGVDSGGDISFSMQGLRTLNLAASYDVDETTAATALPNQTESVGESVTFLVAESSAGVALANQSEGFSIGASFEVEETLL